MAPFSDTNLGLGETLTSDEVREPIVREFMRRMGWSAAPAHPVCRRMSMATWNERYVTHSVANLYDALAEGMLVIRECREKEDARFHAEPKRSSVVLPGGPFSSVDKIKSTFMPGSKVTIHGRDENDQPVTETVSIPVTTIADVRRSLEAAATSMDNDADCDTVDECLRVALAELTDVVEQMRTVTVNPHITGKPQP